MSVFGSGDSENKDGKKAKKPFKIKMTKELKVFLATLLIAFIFVVGAGLTRNMGIIANAILISTLIVSAPQFLFLYEKYRNIKEMEERFPFFLRDIIESLRSGLPLHKAIISSSSFEYGKLTPEIKMMANKLSWGIPLEKVLSYFAKKVKRSNRLYTSVNIIREAHLSGGDVISTLETVANNSRILEESEKERRSTLNQYVVLMYGIVFIFIGIVVAINRLMLPIFEVTTGSAGIGGGQAMGISNPCFSCFGFSCFICNFYSTIADALFSLDPNSIGAYYISLFFSMSLMQAIFSGLVAGQIGENSVTAGIKHSMIMVAITFCAFYFLVYLGFLGG